MKHLADFLSSAYNRGIITDYQVSSDGCVCQIKSDTKTLNIRKNGNRWFLFQEAGSAREYLTSNTNAIIRLVANTFLGLVDGKFNNNKYPSANVIPSRILNSAVEFTTANGKKFIVSTSNTRITLGLYDLLYSANSEHSILMLPELFESNPVPIENSFSLFDEKLVSIRSAYLNKEAATTLGDFVVPPSDVATYAKLNQCIGDFTKVGTKVPKFSSLVSNASYFRAISAPDGYDVQILTSSEGLEYQYEGTANVSLPVLSQCLNQEGQPVSSLSHGVMLTNPDSMKVLSSVIDRFKSTMTLTGSPSCKRIQHTDPAKIASGWMKNSESFLKVTSHIWEY